MLSLGKLCCLLNAVAIGSQKNKRPDRLHRYKPFAETLDCGSLADVPPAIGTIRDDGRLV